VGTIKAVVVLMVDHGEVRTQVVVEAAVRVVIGAQTEAMDLRAHPASLQNTLALLAGL